MREKERGGEREEREREGGGGFSSRKKCLNLIHGKLIQCLIAVIPIPPPPLFLGPNNLASKIPRPSPAPICV